MAALEMLKILATSEASNYGSSSAAEPHKKIEAMKLAYTDLYRYDANPRFAKVPVTGLLSEAYAKERAALIDPEKANCEPASGKPTKSDTTYLVVVDRREYRFNDPEQLRLLRFRGRGCWHGFPAPQSRSIVRPRSQRS